jgi:uncharacterized DUF497 family protein
MEIADLRISERVADKIWSQHAVSEDEVREVFQNPDDPVQIRRSDKVSGSYVALGRTYAGRYLMVAFFPKEGGTANLATARDMTVSERRLYARK